MKRGREAIVTVDDAVVAAQAICELQTNLLFGECITTLPYPGIGTPPGRPPAQLDYVGSEFLLDLAQHWCSPDKKARLLIEGPRGFGKSSDLRAMACLLYRDFVAKDGSKDRLVSIWNLEAALDEVVKVVQDAILFAFLVKWEGELAAVRAEKQAQQEQEQNSKEEEEGEEQEVEEQADIAEEEEQELYEEPLQDFEAETGKLSQVLAEREALTEEIRQLDSIDAALAFIKKRKKDHGEIFHFIADGWEVLDTEDSHQQPSSRRMQREKVQNSLSKLFSEGSSVCLSASAKSVVAKRTRRNWDVITKSQAFSEREYATYAKTSILGKLQRDEQIYFYTGHVPWLLDVLNECCQLFSRQRNADARKALVEQTVSGGGICRLGKLSLKLPQLSISNQELAQLLVSDDDSWAAVLKLFREHQALRQVADNIDAIQLGLHEQCYDYKDMGRKDKTYFIVKEDRYCCGFIARMYIQGFREKEKLARQHARGVCPGDSGCRPALELSYAFYEPPQLEKVVPRSGEVHKDACDGIGDNSSA